MPSIIFRINRLIIMKVSRTKKFLQLTHQILEKDEYNAIISWNSDGTGFYIKNIDEFEDKVLPKYFKHNRYSSYLRQLNSYNFKLKKQASGVTLFLHDEFHRNSQSFSNIERKSGQQASWSQEFDSLKNQLIKLHEAQRELIALVQQQTEFLDLIKRSVMKSFKAYLEQIVEGQTKGQKIFRFIVYFTRAITDQSFKKHLSKKFEQACKLQYQPFDSLSRANQLCPFRNNDIDSQQYLFQIWQSESSNYSYSSTPVPFNFIEFQISQDVLKSMKKEMKLKKKKQSLILGNGELNESCTPPYVL